tara:strand:- start:399 stop:695 length:297 start_codon:yes stop_codon:yes gene_type:complete
LFNDEGVMRTLVDTDSTPNAEALRNVRFTGFLVKNDAFLTVTNRWTKGMAFIVALLWLTIVLFEDCDSHSFTSCCCNVCFWFGLKELSPKKPQQTRFV